MLQHIGGVSVYVVEFDSMPELPITGSNRIETLYARVLTDAIQKGLISEPGKYGLHLKNDPTLKNGYDLFKIIK